MIEYSKDHAGISDTDQIGQIASCLSDNFVKPLFDFRGERKYSGYVKSLAEILIWSHEFYKKYYHILIDWGTFEKSKDNIYNAANWNDFLVAWGNKRMNQFFAQNMNEQGAYTGKYANRTATNDRKNKQNNLSARIAT